MQLLLCMQHTGVDCHHMIVEAPIIAWLFQCRCLTHSPWLPPTCIGNCCQADIQMHSYQNGTSERCKLDNWDQIRKACHKNALLIPDKLIEGAVQGTPGAAVAVLETLYEKFTNKK